LVNELFGNRNSTQASLPNRHEILNKLERGEITAKVATQLLKEQT